MNPIFSRNDDIDKIAFLNWRISYDEEIRNLLNMADGFMLSAIRVARMCLINNGDKSADILIFPILTNANHGIELYLKGIMWTLHKLMKSDMKIEGSHNIKQIYETVSAKIKVYKGQISHKEFKNATADLRAYIGELFNKIEATPQKDKMDFSRYPFNNKYENHFYVDIVGNVEVDLENFVTRFEAIKQTLENIADFLIYQELYKDPE
ncbi:hypothetical protein SAMN05216464_11373 [Mucilaginibacter pineti]|uniref:HEPN domain-containing protein n=1 Tax=Mucilaginibacter pineti TaxID=1391627 RepID=A0A1G7IL85_9SPHI|nr:hypothetical protein [Mucilaginibacter pineti]SDF13403.1 hypothetical protein SAMN05216464_11373 [Mucilaginibacter pineti]